MLTSYGHLTYCSNIHPGVNWDDHFSELKSAIPQVRQSVAGTNPMAIGLRLAHEASIELENPARLQELKSWLEANNLYVFCINGFPYGNFHQSVVKDYVHAPDWTTSDRLEYTKRLFRILVELLPDNLTGAVSTPPLSYRHWWRSPEDLSYARTKATTQILDLVGFLIELEEKTGRTLHVDIEPEPDGILSNGKDFFAWYTQQLLPECIEYLKKVKGYSTDIAKSALFKHVRLCYDVCHFAVSFESPAWVQDQLLKTGIQVGRLQLSSALKVDLTQDKKEKLALLARQFNEPVYLHQVVARTEDGQFIHYPDLDDALADADSPTIEWRVHFHVPLFMEHYGLLGSTQSQTQQVLALQKQNPITTYMEVETYTWSVLPEALQRSIPDAISRELNWVKQQLEI